MASTGENNTTQFKRAVEAATAVLPEEGVRFDAIFVGVSVVLMTGLAWDFQVHAGGVTFEEEGFWTIPHMLVYGGGLSIAVLLITTVWRNQRRGKSWARAVPTGYRLGLIGLVIFGIAGASDSVWHTVISHEDTALEALTSPSHLGLAVGGALFLSSPLRAAWRRDGTPPGPMLLPALLSLSFVLSIAVVFAAYANPLTATQILYDPVTGPVLGLGAMIVFPVVLVATALVLVRRFALPLGAILLTYFIPSLVSVTAVSQFELLIPVCIAALVGEAFVAIRPPTSNNPGSLRLFGAAVPVAFAMSFFIVVELWHGLAPVWTTHLWTGAVVVAGLSGLLFTYAIIPDTKRRNSSEI